MERFRALAVIAILVFSSLPVSGIDSPSSESTYVSEIPEVKVNQWEELPWWETTSRDLNRNGIVDWLEGIEDEYAIGVIYDHLPNEDDIALLSEIGVSVNYHVNAVNGLLLGSVNSELFQIISDFPGVLMIEPYGKVIFYGDVQTPAIKASNSSVYSEGAWDLGYTGNGVNIAIVDTGIDDEHPGLAGKAVAGYDAVCTDDVLCMASFQEDDGSFDPDDQNQHGTACAGMATSTGTLASGDSSNFTGAAPDANLVDVRIGTAFGAGPFENYIIEQEFCIDCIPGETELNDKLDVYVLFVGVKDVFIDENDNEIWDEGEAFTDDSLNDIYNDISTE